MSKELIVKKCVVLNWLKMVWGYFDGIVWMLEFDVYCVDVMK